MQVRRRSSCEPLEFINVKATTPIPVQAKIKKQFKKFHVISR